MKRDKPKRKPFHEEFAEKIIAHLEAGTAPWQKPWHPGKAAMAPHNPVSGSVYKGMNRVNLSLSGYEDSRWMTFRQANDQGLRIKPGSKATPIVFYQFTEEKNKLDKDDQPVLDEEGKPTKQTVLLERPLLRFAQVFNAEQIEGMPPLELTDKAFEWEPVEKAESIMAASGATIRHDQSDRAFYRLATDEIHLPPKENFAEAGLYYGTALHELGHWTRHESRLNRENGPFGSELYAQEELRAEISSWMLGQDIGIPHDPGQHAAYVGSWVKALKEDPFEIVRACRDAEQIKKYILELDMKKELGQEQVVKTPEKNLESDNHTAEMPAPAAEKTFLAVPYKEKEQAKKLGARWDKENKLWYVPEGENLALFDRWRDGQERPLPHPALSASQELGKLITDLGGELRGEMPVMDGKIQRIPCFNRQSGNRDFSYCAYNDEHPAGWVQNFASGEKVTWSYSGHELNEVEKIELRKRQAEHAQTRRMELDRQHDRVAQECAAFFNDRAPANGDHGYLLAKGVEPDGLKVTPDGQRLVVPLYNSAGDIRSLQYISENGFKGFEPGGEKKGNFFVLGCAVDELKSQEKILLAEGFSTSASLHQASGLPTVMAGDIYNMQAVASEIRKLAPEAELHICADNDHARRLPCGKPNNIGVERAKEVARVVGAALIIPQLTAAEKEKGLKDFNDIHSSRGLLEVTKQVQAGLNKSMKQELAV